jgi:hypothetical protein
MDGDYLSARQTSVAPDSEASVPSSPSWDVIHCNQCDAEFQGEYRIDNYNRHRRLYHGRQGGTLRYHCHDPSCSHVFRRQDSLLKHHRQHHPHLGETTAVLRRPLQPESFEPVKKDFVFPVLAEESDSSLGRDQQSRGTHHEFNPAYKQVLEELEVQSVLFSDPIKPSDDLDASSASIHKKFITLGEQQLFEDDTRSRSAPRTMVHEFESETLRDNPAIKSNFERASPGPGSGLDPFTALRESMRNSLSSIKVLEQLGKWV